MLRILVLITGFCVTLSLFMGNSFNASGNEPDMPLNQFTDDDGSKFSSNVRIDGKFCQFALQDYDLCLTSAPKESLIEIGEPLPEELNARPAPWPVLVSLQPKDAGLRIRHYGSSLVLLDPETQMVIDVLKPAVAPN